MADLLDFVCPDFVPMGYARFVPIVSRLTLRAVPVLSRFHAQGCPDVVPMALSRKCPGFVQDNDPPPLGGRCPTGPLSRFCPAGSV